jgi:hypothetical protein
MSDTQTTIYYSVFLGLAFVVIPASYLALCVWMTIRRSHWISFLAHFFLFGTVGGWCLAFGLSPSPLAAISIVFLLLTCPVCLITSLCLRFRKDRNRFDSVAMVGGYAYSILLAGAFVTLPFLVGQ